jgi:hypothetical protein
MIPKPIRPANPIRFKISRFIKDAFSGLITKGLSDVSGK